MNRNKLIEVFISNLVNSIVHQVLERAIVENELVEKYDKEVKNSWQIAKKYREKINPIDRSLPIKDCEEIKEKIIRRVRLELNLRISRGYTGINLDLVEELVNSTLKDLRVV